MPDSKELPQASDLNRRDLDIEIAAMERGITPEEEFRRRQEALGNHVVTTSEPLQPTRIGRAIGWILDRF